MSKKLQNVEKKHHRKTLNYGKKLVSQDTEMIEKSSNLSRLEWNADQKGKHQIYSLLCREQESATKYLIAGPKQ